MVQELTNSYATIDIAVFRQPGGYRLVQVEHAFLRKLQRKGSFERFRNAPHVEEHIVRNRNTGMGISGDTYPGLITGNNHSRRDPDIVFALPIKKCLVKGNLQFPLRRANRRDPAALKILRQQGYTMLWKDECAKEQCREYLAYHNYLVEAVRLPHIVGFRFTAPLA